MSAPQATAGAPRISIITVTYNCAAVVADALQSVARQTHPAIEHLVIDGQSTDGTLDVVREHGAHVARLVSEKDRGIYDAMNKGLALVSGDWVGFLNADDILAEPDTIARMVECISQSPRADVVYGDLVYVNAEDTRKVLRYWQSGSFSQSRLRFGWMPPHPTFYVRTEVVRRVGPFDADMRIAADYDFVLRCLRQPGLVVRYLPRVLVRMRTGGASNRSLKALVRKSSEDLRAIRRSGVGGWATLACKNLRKIPQWLGRPSPTAEDSR